MKQKNPLPDTPKSANIFSLLPKYGKYILAITVLAIAASGLGLIVPKLIAKSIDTYIRNTFQLHTFLWEFGALTVAISIFTYAQSILQTYASEQVARDLRNTLAAKISNQSYGFIEKVSPGKLLTNLTSDIDSVKLFVGQAITTLISSVIIIIGGSILLISINWQLALAVLCMIPLIGLLFFFIFRKVGTLMKNAREVIDWLNKVINESILGSSLIRVLNSEQPEFHKFMEANTKAKDTGLQILRLFVTLIPLVTFVANLAVLTVLILGGHFVIGGSMSLGDFAAFNSYIALLIFPILLVGIMGNVIAQSSASYARIAEVIDMKDESETGTLREHLKGHVSVQNVVLELGEKIILKNISFEAPPKSKIAIIGPTAAGKTQLLYLLTGLIKPKSGVIEYDSHPIDEYESENFHRQIGFVFQDSIIFNITLRENIGFGDTVSPENMNKALETAELQDFVESLPQKLDTVISERGASLSGGQKQRIMLARALALNPKVLLLDDFTARVDNKTEAKILANIEKNYPDLTLISVTQKISSIENYDQVILLMEGEILAIGTHKELLSTSPEYVQIYNSQKSTNHYE